MITNEDRIELTDGEWRPDRHGIQRWYPATVTIREIRPEPEVPVACKCGARRNESCRTKSGHRTQDHVDRWLPRACACGASLSKPGARSCADCVRARALETKRAWYARQKVAA